MLIFENLAPWDFKIAIQSQRWTTEETETAEKEERSAQYNAEDTAGPNFVTKWEGVGIREMGRLHRQ